MLAFWRSEALFPSTGLESLRKRVRTGCSCVCSFGNGNSCPTDCWRKDRNHCERESSIVRFGRWIFFARSFYFERLASWKWCWNILAHRFFLVTLLCFSWKITLCTSSRSVGSNQERMVPFSSIYEEGVPSGAHSTRQGLLALTARFFRLVLCKSLEACFKMKATNPCKNCHFYMGSLWTIICC